MRSVRVTDLAAMSTLPTPLVVDSRDASDLLLSEGAMRALAPLTWTLLAEDDDAHTMAAQLGWTPEDIVTSLDEVQWEATVVRVF